MKLTTKALFAALMLLAISCKKESTSIPNSSIAEEGATQALSFEVNEIAGGRVVKIGTQVWMTKNLDVTRYRNGDRIPQVKDPVKWSKLTTGAWCWYNNDSANCAIYGKLYNWDAVNDPRGLAPEGWHISSNAEWDTLSTYLRNNAGGKMKSTGTIEAGTGLWHEPNGDATNSSGFTGLPGGYRYNNGTFYDIGYYGYWWSSTEFNTTYAWSCLLYYTNGNVDRYEANKQYGFSVRCVKD